MIRIHHYETDEGATTIVTGQGDSLLHATGLPATVYVAREETARLIKCLNRRATRSSRCYSSSGDWEGVREPAGN